MSPLLLHYCCRQDSSQNLPVKKLRLIWESQVPRAAVWGCLFFPLLLGAFFSFFDTCIKSSLKKETHSLSRGTQEHICLGLSVVVALGFLVSQQLTDLKGQLSLPHRQVLAFSYLFFALLTKKELSLKMLLSASSSCKERASSELQTSLTGSRSLTLWKKQAGARPRPVLHLITLNAHPVSAPLHQINLTLT